MQMPLLFITKDLNSATVSYFVYCLYTYHCTVLVSDDYKNYETTTGAVLAHE